MRIIEWFMPKKAATKKVAAKKVVVAKEVSSTKEERPTNNYKVRLGMRNPRA